MVGKINKNLLIICFDALRKDFLKTYNPEVLSENIIDRLAMEGAIFDNAITNGNWTIPAHASLFSGSNFYMHKVINWHESLPSNIPTLFEIFRRIGFQSGIFSSDSIQELIKHDLPNFSWVDNTYSDLIFEAIKTDNNFCIFWHFIDTHAPYGIIPPKNFPINNIDFELERQDFNYLRYLIMSDQLSTIIQACRFQLNRACHRVEELIDQLVKNGKWENTIIVILSDHGELWSKYEPFHCNFSEEVLRIPLIFLGPNVPKGRYSEMVSLIDVLPTLLELICGQNGSISDTKIEGQSLVTLFNGNILPARCVYICGPNAFENKELYVAIRNERWLLISNQAGIHEELYLYDSDIKHKINYIDNKMMSQNVKATYLILKEAIIQSFSKMIDIKLVSPKDSPEEVLERLKQLGYI